LNAALPANALALQAMLEGETDSSPHFRRLASALSALYPKDSEEKRMLDVILLAVRSQYHAESSASTFDRPNGEADCRPLSPGEDYSLRVGSARGRDM